MKKKRFGFDRIGDIITEYKVDKIIVGFPKNMNNTVGPRGEAAKAYARPRRNFKLPVILWDERLSTIAAERVLLEADVSRKKRKKVIDKMAAVMILQGYLNSQQ